MDYNQDLLYPELDPACKDEISKFDYWNTWALSSYIAAGIGGYFGILYQHKKYGG